jgi:hypothetical protein
MPNAPAASGNALSCAVAAAASVGAAWASPSGSSEAHQRRASDPKTVSPHTAQTPRASPRSSATGGDEAIIAAASRDTDARASRRLPASPAAAEAAYISSARSIDTRKPVSAAYALPAAQDTATCITSGRPARRAQRWASTQTSPR